jgi:hypothetical protein
LGGGANGPGTGFEITGQRLRRPADLRRRAGKSAKANCQRQSVSALARQFGGLNAAVEALGYPSVRKHCKRRVLGKLVAYHKTRKDSRA